ANRLIVLQIIYTMLDKRRMKVVITVQHSDITRLRRRHHQGAILGKTNTPILVVVKNANRRAETFQYVPCLISRTIIDHDDLDPGERLLQNRFDTLADK